MPAMDKATQDALNRRAEREARQQAWIRQQQQNHAQQQAERKFGGR